MTLLRKRVVALTALMAMVLVALPVVSLAQGDDLNVSAADAYVRDDELVLINRTDGKIVVRDYALGANLANLNVKHSEWGGPWYDVAAGDFNGDGTKEIVAIGGAAIGNQGPIMQAFDPVQAIGEAVLPGIGSNVNPYVYYMVGTGDIDADGRDEVVAVRTHANGTNNTITAMVECWELTGSAWAKRWQIESSGGFYDMAIGDLDSDGKADIGFVRTGKRVVVIDGENPNTDIFDYTFSGPLADWNGISITDVNGDHSNDLELLRPQFSVSGNSPAAVLAIHPTGINTYTDIAGWGFGAWPQSMEVGDTNGDGVSEIAVLRVAYPARYEILNSRLGTNNGIESERGLDQDLWNQRFVLADTNGDGLKQVVLMYGLNDGAFLRLYDHRTGVTYDDDATNGPFWDNFVAANLDGSGVATGPTMVVPGAVTVYYVGGSTAIGASVKVANVGSDTFNWTVSGAPAWLGVSTTTGAAGGTFALSINTATLPAGNATASLQVAASGTKPVTNANQTITVNLVQVPQLSSIYLPMTMG
jgi:hypothetical protein